MTGVMVGADRDPSGRLRPLCELPQQLPLLDAVRGSVVVLDQRALRERGLFPRYERALGGAHPLFAITASEWVPLATASDHWRALDALELPAHQIQELGRKIAEDLHGPFLATLLRLARQLGTTPWAALRQAHKLWSRSWRGGGMLVRPVSDTSAELAVIQVPVVESPWVRNSLMGAVVGGVAPLCRRLNVRELASERSAHSYTMLVSW
jgi:hypothetical protein